VNAALIAALCLGLVHIPVGDGNQIEPAVFLCRNGYGTAHAQSHVLNPNGTAVLNLKILYHLAQPFADDMQRVGRYPGQHDGEFVTAIACRQVLRPNMGTLRGWMKRALRDQKNPSGKAIPWADWTPAQRLLALHESHGLGEEALNAWCRERGIFAHDLTQWRTDFCESTGTAGWREDSEELRQLRFDDYAAAARFEPRGEGIAAGRSVAGSPKKISGAGAT
jgi:hypothetical protein